MAAAATTSERKSSVPRPSGRPVAPTPPRVAPPTEKAGTLIGVAPPKSQPAPATASARVPEPPPSSRGSLDAKPLLPARTPNRIAIVQGASISAAMRAAPVATMQPEARAPTPMMQPAPIAAPMMQPAPTAAPMPIVPPVAPSATMLPPPGLVASASAPAPTAFDKTVALPNRPSPPGPRPSSPGPRFDKVARWSQPQLATPLPVTRSVPPAPVSEEPLTYQVYTPSSIASTPMSSMRSGSMIILPTEKASLTARIVTALVAVGVVVATAAIVVLGTGDERASKAAATNAIGVTAPADPPPPVSTELAPPPAVDPPPAATAAEGAPQETATKKKRRGIPRSIKNAKPPPNPYEGATAKR